MLPATSKFIEIWQTANTIGEACAEAKKAGLPCNPSAVRKRASNLRQQGIPLKKYKTSGEPKEPGKKMGLAVVHEYEDPNWQTPDWIVDVARELLGEIDLDPASDEEANGRISADRFFAEEDDGLKQRWDTDGYPSRVFLNPPGRQVLEFWDKLVTEWNANRVMSAFWVGFNVDHLRWLSTRPQHPLGFYWCMPRSRVKFLKPNGTEGKSRPSCANYLVWLPDEDCNENWARFCEVMGKHGRCVRGTEGFYSGEPYVKHNHAGISFRARRLKLRDLDGGDAGLCTSDGDRTGAGS